MASKQDLKLTADWPVLGIFLVIAYEWLSGGWEKISGGEFVAGLPKTLGYFASKNPYPWFKDFLTTTAIPSADMFGNLVMFGEILAGLAIVGGILAVLFLKGEKGKFGRWILASGLAGGFFLSAIFYLAAGWTGPSTSGVNLVMAVVELMGLIWVMKEA